MPAVLLGVGALALGRGAAGGASVHRHRAPVEAVEGGARVTVRAEDPPKEEDENPYTADADTTEECYAWTADGAC